jgi:hypothetical protein
MRKCKWSFDDERIYDGFTDDTYWNGFLNVSVTPEVRDEIVKNLRAELADGDIDQAEAIGDIAALPIMDGLVSFAGGYATSEVAQGETAE